MKKGLEQLLTESNQNRNFIESSLSELPLKILHQKPDEKSWSVIEIVDHLNKVYDIYIPNLTQALNGADELIEDSSSKTTIMGQISIYSMKPKGGKRKFKMKTFDFFQPHVESEKERTLEIFMANKDKFNDIIRTARGKNLRKTKVATALGERIKFYFVECIAFVLAHETRHLVQIEDILSQ